MLSFHPDHLRDTWVGEQGMSSPLVRSCECGQPAGIFSLLHLSLIFSTKQTEVEQAVYLPCSSRFPGWPLLMLVHYVRCPMVPGGEDWGVAFHLRSAQALCSWGRLLSRTGDHWHLPLSILVTPAGTARVTFVPRLLGFLWAHWALHYANYRTAAGNRSLCNRGAQKSGGRESGVGKEFPSQDADTQG